MNAVKNAATDGLVPGGGAALLHASRLLEGMEGDNLDETLGIKTLARAIQDPFKAILDNAGMNPEYFALKVIETEDWRKGVCARRGQIVDMLETGVV
jgi:chaperonin GroEL